MPQRHRATATSIFFILALAFVSCGKKPGAEHAPPAVGAPPALAPGEIESLPLAGRLAGRGPLFDALGADETGIDFVHRWEPKDAFEADQLGNAFAGGAVAIGDYDLDGLADIFLTRPHGGGRLFRNLGGFRFLDATAEAGLAPDLAGHWASGATFVDIDGDGFLDLYACGYRCANKLFINTRDGRFIEQAAAFGLDFEGASIAMSFADYDRDGDLDAYLLTNRLAGQPKPEQVQVAVKAGVAEVPEADRENIGVLVKPDGSLFQYDAGQADHLYRNDPDPATGGRKFTEVSGPAGIRGNWHGLSATWWDYDSDGWIDLYVANDFFGPDHLYHNNQNGTFSDTIAAAVPNTPWYSMGSDAGDLNNDGRLDFIAADMAATTHYKQKVNMGDMDENGWFLEHGLPRQYMRNAVYLNTGTARFLEVANLTGMASTDWTWAVKILDLDSDGRNDVFFSNGMTRNFFNADLRAEVRAIKEKTGENRWEDYQMQKEPDRAFRNLGDLRFEDVGAAWGLDHEGVSFGAAAGDLDGDGDLDIVVNHFGEAAGIYRNGSAENNLLVVALAGAAGNRFGVGAEIGITAGGTRQVRVVNPVRGFMGCDSAEVHFGLGASTTVDEIRIRWPSGRRQVLEGLDANRRYVIAEPGQDRTPAAPGIADQPAMFSARVFSPTTHEDKPFDDFAAQPLLPNQLSQLGPAMAWADVNGEGKADLFYGGGTGQPAQLWIQLEDGNLAKAPVAAFNSDRECEDIDAAFFDADGDGDLDLYVVSGSVEAPVGSPALDDRLYLNTGRGFERAMPGALPDMSFSGSCIAPADFDGDGDIDLMVGARVIPGQYPLAPGSRLLRNETAKSPGAQPRFADVTSELAAPLAKAGMVTDATWVDADGDGDPDLIATTEYGPVRYFENSAGTLAEKTADAGLGTRTGWWNAIDASDVDGDGDIDLAVANFGLNTKYHPSPDHPQILYYGDFDGGGKPMIVEAHLDGSALVPVRGRSCSSAAMPSLKEKFATFHDFASADLAGIYTPQRLDGALRLEANELSTGILLNDGKAHFSFLPLPRLAQVSPCFGLAFLDADGDGHDDLYLSQNFFGPQRETGRMAGGVGLLLLGQGDGTFLPIWPADSGIVIPDDARSVTAIDINGDRADDLAVAVNSGPVRLLLNTRRGKKN